MSVLLDDIIHLAADGNQPLPDILRKCLILGHELKNNRLKEWANQELNGYKSGRDVPDYRIIPAQARGNFIGPFHAQFPGHIIPPAALDNDVKAYAERVYLLQSVSAYEDLVGGGRRTHGSLVFNWPSDMVAYYQDKLMQGGFICHSAWQEIPPSALVELLDNIRNRTLNMALSIKEELGTSFSDLHKAQSTEAAMKIQNIVFQNTGGTTNVALDESSLDASAQGQRIIAVGDLKALDAVLSEAGLTKTDLDRLSQAVEADGNKLGNKLKEWVKESASKILAGGVKVGTKIGTEILTAWLKQYFGL